MIAREFRPNWSTPPGDTIREILFDRHISIEDFARQMGLTQDSVSNLIEGRTAITLNLAKSLVRVLGASPEFWITRDYNYREAGFQQNSDVQQWLRDLPVSDMIKFGWLTPPPKAEDQLESCLDFFGVDSIVEWQSKYRDIFDLTAFRTSRTFESRPASVVAWLRQAEIAANEIACLQWDSRRARAIVPELRELTRLKSPAEFLPQLQRLCASVGIALCVIRAPNGCRASGAAFFVGSDKAAIALSFRHLTDDQFWFTFFHELGHLILHGEHNMFLDGLGADDPFVEQEANGFAEETLIPPIDQARLASLPLDKSSIIRFSRAIGVSPGIVVGQLQHVGRVKFNELNGLKRRYSWG